MDRRKALKGLGLSLGYLVAIPTAISTLESCSKKEASWSPVFLNKNEQQMMDHLVDIILPASDTPGGLDLRLPQFIDMMCNDTFTETDKKLFHEGSQLFSKRFEKEFSKEIGTANKVDLQKHLSSYFDLGKEEQERVVAHQHRRIESLSEKEKVNFTTYTFLIAVRNLSLLGYFTSEQIGTEVLNFDPIPGVYLPCIPEGDIGNAWTI